MFGFSSQEGPVDLRQDSVKKRLSRRSPSPLPDLILPPPVGLAWLWLDS